MLLNLKRNGHKMDSRGSPLVVNLLKGMKHPQGNKVSCPIGQLFQKLLLMTATMPMLKTIPVMTI